MSESKPVPQLALLVDQITPDASGSAYGGSTYLTCTVEFVAREGDTITNLSWSDYGGDPMCAFADLRFRAQTDDSTAKQGGHWYGWSFEYHSPWTVTYQRAVAMAKTLKRVEDKIKEQNDFFGTPPDFVSYMLRVASILKVRHFARIRRYGGNYQNSEIIWLNPDSFRFYIDKREQEFIDSFKPADAPAMPEIEVDFHRDLTPPEPSITEEVPF